MIDILKKEKSESNSIENINNQTTEIIRNRQYKILRNSEKEKKHAESYEINNIKFWERKNMQNQFQRTNCRMKK